MRVRLLPALFAAVLAASEARAQECPRPPSAYPTMQAVPHASFRPEKQAWVRQQLRSQAFSVIALGDSIMEGWPIPLLDDPLGRPALNAGFGMDGTEQVLWRLRTVDWAGQSPSTVLLLVGTNDLRYPACEVYWGIETVVASVHQRFPAARVVVTSILPRGERLNFKDHEITAINWALRRSAAARNYIFLDVHNAFLCNHVTPCKLFLPGNLHLTAAGYKLLTRLAAKHVGPQ